MMMRLSELNACVRTVFACGVQRALCRKVWRENMKRDS
jgi:hypothetical protein